VIRVTKRPSLPPDLKLSAEEGFVLSRIENTAELRELESLTGLAPAQVEAIVSKLERSGAVDLVRADADADANANANVLPRALPVHDVAVQDVNAAEDEGSSESDNLTHRARWSENFRGLPSERRRVLAASAESEDLLALAYDPDPQVIRAVLANRKSGAQVARIVAAHAQTSVALEALARFVQDSAVHRLLLRNGHTSEGMLRRLLSQRPLSQVYAAATDRDAAEVPRTRAKALFRERFAQGSSEEKAALLLKTEGRVLQLLSGVPLDARTASLLCAKTVTSSLFVQNIARYTAAPPALLLHLVRQPFVRRQAQLEKLLLQHPNMPREGKTPK
jgi:hypothetical protein